MTVNNDIDLEQAWGALEDLITGRTQKRSDDLLPGAELVVSDGDTALRVALARHARRDPDEPALCWVRPVAAALQDPETGLPMFDPAVTRRRALHVAAARLEGNRLLLELVTGQQVTIQPARSSRLQVLQDFDTWMTTISDDEREALDGLEHD